MSKNDSKAKARANALIGLKPELVGFTKDNLGLQRHRHKLSEEYAAGEFKMIVESFGTGRNLIKKK